MSRKKKKRKLRTSKRSKPRAARRSPLPIILLGSVLIVGIAALLIWANQPMPAVPLEVSGAPSLKADRQVIDFGEVRLGQWVSTVFEIANVGDQALHFIEQPWVEVVEGC